MTPRITSRFRLSSGRPAGAAAETPRSIDPPVEGAQERFDLIELGRGDGQVGELALSEPGEARRQVVDDHSEGFVGFDTSKLRNAVAIAASGRTGEVRFLGKPSMENVEKLASCGRNSYGRQLDCYIP
jgi:hypothetical protein